MTVPIVEMMGFGVIEVDSQFDQTKPEDADIEIDILLRVAAEGSDMM
jgi:hypothetical protein